LEFWKLREWNLKMKLGLRSSGCLVGGRECCGRRMSAGERLEDLVEVSGGLATASKLEESDTSSYTCTILQMIVVSSHRLSAQIHQPFQYIHHFLLILRLSTTKQKSSKPNKDVYWFRVFNIHTLFYLI
jgi:hypothetical protein